MPHPRSRMPRVLIDPPECTAALPVLYTAGLAQYGPARRSGHGAVMLALALFWRSTGLA